MTSTNASRPIRPSSVAKLSNPTGRSSWKIPSPPKTWVGFEPCDSKQYAQSPWASCSSIAMSGCFFVAERLIDFIRIHISAVGGLNMARKVASCCEFFNVRTAWHGPGNVSPVGHAINMHLDLASFNFGIQEENRFSAAVREVFPGAPEIKGGYMYANDRAGLGIDIDERAAAKFPYKGVGGSRGNDRRLDGSIVRP
jgi:Enolase C-terminal domain-like